jgi:hypothetical protein
LRKKNAADDDDYVRVTWVGSNVQSEVHKIVVKWLSESRTCGRGGAKGSQNLGAMFGWGASAPVKPTQEHKRQLSLGIGKVMPAIQSHSRHASEVGPQTPPLPSVKPSIEQTHTPLTPTFGWASASALPSPFLKTSFSVAASPLGKTSFDVGVLNTAHSSAPASRRVSLALGRSSMQNSPTTSPFVSTGSSGAETSLPISNETVSLGLLARPSQETTVPAQTAVSSFDDWDKFDTLNKQSSPHPPIKPAAQADEWSAFENLVSSVPESSVKCSDEEKRISQGNIDDGWAIFESIKPTPSPALPSGSASPVSSRNSTNISQPNSILSAQKLPPKATAAPPMSEVPVPQIQPSKPAALSVSTNSELVQVETGDDDEWGEMQSPSKSEHDATSISAPVTASPAILPVAAMEPSTSIIGGDSFAGLNGFSANVFSPSTYTGKPSTSIQSGCLNFGGAALPAAESSDSWDLSVFEQPSKPQPPAQMGVWDAPMAAPTRGKKEMEEDETIKRIIDGLPDLSYMLA